jgi:catechol 2,3-dioxygenase-like lactoylglutathione lyase family enzyme
MANAQVTLNTISIVVRDMAATIAFYRRLGVNIPEDSVWLANGVGHHVTVKMANDFNLDFDSEAMTKAYDPAWKPGAGANAIIFHVSTREDVDRLYSVMTAAGHVSHLGPFDAFWGARYAVIDDPDGNHVGIMSPMDEKYGSPPPQL